MRLTLRGYGLDSTLTCRDSLEGGIDLFRDHVTTAFQPSSPPALQCEIALGCWRLAGKTGGLEDEDGGWKAGGEGAWWAAVGVYGRVA